MTEKTSVTPEDEHRKALLRYSAAEEGDRENRLEALDDLKFRAGEQWGQKEKAERVADGRPCITTNRMPQFVRQVTGDIRQNKPAVKVRPVEEGDVGIAEIYTGLIRNIEQVSDADTAYITAVEHAAAAGMGHWRINVEYSSDDAFEQDIRIRRIPNPFGVLWDPLATELDRSDARYCFVPQRMPREEFKARWPDATVQDFEVDGAASDPAATALASGWGDKDTVRVAEYWYKVPETRELALYPGGQVLDKAAPAPVGPDQQPLAALRTRTVTTYRIVQRLMSGAEFLGEESEWAGRYIPIIPVIGEEVNIGERVVRHGIVRFAKDPQRVFNYMRTTAVEAIALAPKQPFLVTEDEIKAHRSWWLNAGKKNYPFLPYTPDPKATGRPARISPAGDVSSLISEAALAADDMKAVTGIYDAALGQRSNETSGKAINARQREADTGTFVYIDNLAKAIGYCGRQLVDLIPRIYDTERVIRVLGEDGNDQETTINQATIVNGQPVVLNDLSTGKYDVVVQTGPSYATKRVEAMESMLAFVQAVPQAGAVTADLIAKNADWPGAEALSERLKKLLPPGIDEEGPPQPPPADPEQVASAELKKQQARGAELDNTKKELEIASVVGEIRAAVTQAIQTVLNPQGGGMPPAMDGGQPPTPPATGAVMPGINPPPQ